MSSRRQHRGSRALILLSAVVLSSGCLAWLPPESTVPMAAEKASWPAGDRHPTLPYERFGEEVNATRVATEIDSLVSDGPLQTTPRPAPRHRTAPTTPQAPEHTVSPTAADVRGELQGLE